MINTQQNIYPQWADLFKSDSSQKPVALGTAIFPKSNRDFVDLSKIYNIDFVHATLAPDQSQFFAIRDQVYAIENHLLNFRRSLVEPIRLKVKKTLSTQPFQEKMAELGLILFYLDTDPNLSCHHSLLTLRAGEIDLHVRTSENKLTNDSEIRATVIRSFAHLVFTSTGAFNRGGLICVKCFLSNPIFRLAKYFQPEHREHILKVIDHLLSSPAFESLFKKPIKVDPQLKKLIRRDLKLAPHAPINHPDVLYALIMMLFWDIRQSLHVPNCYSISALIYALENYPYKVVSKTLEWLEQGSVICPIYPLTKSHFDDLYSHTQNSLIHMHLSILEFLFLNFEPMDPSMISEKQVFIDICVEGLLLGTNTSDHHPVFVDRLKKNLEKQLWLHSYLKPLALLLSSVVIISNQFGKYKLLNTKDALQKEIVELIHETSIELENEGIKFCNQPFVQATLSPSFQKHLIDGITSIHPDISEEVLLGDAFAWQLPAGIELKVLKLAYQISPSSISLKNCNKPYDLLCRLHEKISAIDLIHSQKISKLLLADSDHDWTCSLSRWEYLDSSPHQFRALIQEHFIHPGEKRLASRVSSFVMRRFSNTGLNPNTTYRTLKKSILEPLNDEQRKKIQPRIEAEFSKISLSKPFLKDILNHLELNLSQESLDVLFKDLGRFPKTPYRWAILIRTLLLEHQIAIKERFEIESAICKVAQLPMSFELGDLNWEDRNGIHSHLVITFSWIKEDLAYFKRDTNSELFDTKDTELYIHYPSFTKN